MPLGQILANLLFIVIFFFGPLLILCGIIAHNYFPKKFDNKLFNDKYFSQLELQIFSKFPLSLLKTLTYLGGTIMPIRYKKRFGGYNFRENISTTMYITSFALFISALIIFFYGTALFLYGIFF